MYTGSPYFPYTNSGVFDAPRPLSPIYASPYGSAPATVPSPEPGFYGYGQPLAQMPAAYGGHEFYPTYGQPQQNMYSTAAPWQTYAAPHSKEKIERGRNLERDQEPAPEVRGRAGIFSIISYLLSRRKEGDEHEELVGKGYERDAKLYLEEYEKYIQQVGIQLPSIDIAFKNMRFTVKDKKSGQEKVLLDNVSGVFEAGTMVAIMGPSGCGKTTVMDCISGKKTAKYTGEVRVNGRELDKKAFRDISSYVPQQDYGFAKSKVIEELRFASQMKGQDGFFASKRTEAQQRNQDFEVMLHAVGLMKVRDSFVGNQLVRGISGGQKRRLTLCKGLVTDPWVVFMDEPTSGLSSSDSEMVMKSCKLIAQYFGTTIITVIHQPRATLFNLFDHVMLMCEGRVAYNGPRADLERYFAGLGFRCPPSDNPADYYLDIITPGVEGAEPERILDAWAANKNAEVMQKVEASFRNEKGLASVEEQQQQLNASLMRPQKKRSFFFQWWMLQKRELLMLRRNIDETMVGIFNSAFLGFIIGALFLDIRNKTDSDGSGLAKETVNYQLSFVFIITLTAAMLSFEFVPMLINERVVFLNERAEGLYGTVPYMLTKMLTRLTLGAIMMVIITAISYFMGGFEVEHYAFFLLTVAASFAALDGTLAFISVMSPTHEVANALAGTFLTLCSLFNGFTSNSRSSPDWIIWIQYVSVAYYSFVAVAGELFETYTRYPWDCRVTQPTPELTQACADLDVGISQAYDLDADFKWPAVGILFAFAVAFWILAVVCQSVFVKLKK
eukprot:CAMPEP_0174379870 /NCGR_PEP_ID=MMETSP0811_2-20130205/122985_1 /TAXON_ID=73025 ORGANISM="Eutreptiella gymnastica-like, Strain CCMP1594" /NCGR_SAMPLE_ID=MMETSP0811_2 /ASSEMBLY_ACC=CAM_ASM_000667 /LENGTH=781 /DNA_ID=CAMNT_0015532525 /DNA_START=30 /DNA_END=2375 /DNA_ORIENTATION=-